LTPSRESNDRTLAACRKYPDRFIPFGHLSTEDDYWEAELERIGELGWKGIKLHQSEISRGPDLEEKTRLVVEKASKSGIRVVLFHLEALDMIGRLADGFPNTTCIIPHMGSSEELDEMKALNPRQSGNRG
jgi:predicted TIM-barrel fold metal-dependent hydrolase